MTLRQLWAPLWIIVSVSLVGCTAFGTSAERGRHPDASDDAVSLDVGDGGSDAQDVVDVADAGVDIQPVDGDVDVPSIDGALDGPPIDTGVDASLIDTGVDALSADGSLDAPAIDTGVDVPPVDTGVDVPPVDTGVDVPPVDTGVDVPPVDTGTACPTGRALCAGTCCPTSEVCQSGSCTPCATGMTFIPGGTFTMGASDLGSDSQPHTVTLSPYCMDTTEVTVTAFASCTASGCGTPETGGTCNWGSGRGNNPINCVTYTQAQTYCQTVRGGNLPTEAQWEFAAGGSEDSGAGTDLYYPWGTAAPTNQLCWSGVSPLSSTCPVMSFAAGDFGLFDMAGDVWEWTRDCYAAYSAGGPTVTDPDIESGSCSNRVIRGGSWYLTYASVFRAAYRSDILPSLGNYGIGFRCARGL